MTAPAADLQIRPATAADAEALAGLAAATFPLACPPELEKAAIDAFIAASLSPASFTAYLADPDRALLLASHGGEAVGYSMLVAGAPADPAVRACVTVDPPIELNKFYVRAQAHGSGLAAALMTATVDLAAGRGAAGIWLGVNQQNVRAQAFYRRGGFEPVGVRHFTVGSTICEDFVLQRMI